MACTELDLTTNAACYRQPCIDADEQKALLIYAKVLELAGAGGTNYTETLTTTLLTDATNLAVDNNEDALRAAEINVAFLKAAAAGASVPATLDLKLAATACLVCVDPLLLARVKATLECQLGATTY